MDPFQKIHDPSQAGGVKVWRRGGVEGTSGRGLAAPPFHAFFKCIPDDSLSVARKPQGPVRQFVEGVLVQGSKEPDGRTVRVDPVQERLAEVIGQVL